MILGLDTSTPECHMFLYKDGKCTAEKKWQADRKLANDLLSQLKDFLNDNSLDFDKLTGLMIFRGPGSYTGLRIGVTVMNTLADSLKVPIVGGVGKQWQKICLQKIQKGETDKIVIPEYGASPHITKPKK